MTSDFRPGVEIRLFRACAMRPTIIIGTNSSVIVDLAMGKISRSTNVFLVFSFDFEPRE